MFESGSITRRQAFGLPLLFSLASCRRGGTRTVGMVPMGRAHVFWQSIHAGANKAARETGLEVEWNGPAVETDIAAQIQIVESMINKRLDAIALAPIDRRALVTVVQRASSAGIPVIVFDSPLDTEAFVAQIATDNYLGGVMAAKKVAELLDGRGDVAIVAATAGSASTMARERGFEQEIRKYPNIRIVDKRFGDSEFAKSMRVAENLLTAWPRLQAFFASNETGTVGSAQAIKARRAAVRLVGFDAGPTLEADLRDGVIDALVVQHPFRMGYDSVMTASRKLQGGAIERIQTIEPKVVTLANIDSPDVREQMKPDLEKYLG